MNQPAPAVAPLPALTRLAATAVASILAGLFVFPATSGSAHFSADKYSHDNNKGCEGYLADPINFKFYGPGAIAENVAEHVSHHSDWDYQHASFIQQVRSEGLCRTQRTHRANCCGGPGGEHNHIRFFYAHNYYGPNSNWTTINYTVGDAHYDAWTWCTHAVPPNGYNKARNRLRTIMESGGHTTHLEYSGNTKPMDQCNDNAPRSDGYVVLAWIG